MKRMVINKSIVYTLILFSVSFFFALLAGSGVSIKILMFFVAALFFVEAISLLWFQADLRWSPRGLFFLGWLLPFFVAQAPIEKYIFNLPKISHTGFAGFFLVSGLLYAAELLIRATRNTKPLSLIESNVAMGTLNQAKYYAPRFACISFGLVAFCVYIASLLNMGGVPPVFHEHVTQAAYKLWAIPGSATIFSLIRLFFLLAFVRWLWKRGHGRRKIDFEDRLFIILGLVLIFCMFGYGKRSVFIFTFLPVAVLFLSAVQVKARHILIFFGITVSLFIFNGYLRATYGFEHFWAGKDFHSIPSAFWYSVAQPAKYTAETFGNFSSVLEASMSDGLLSAGHGKEILDSLPKGKIIPVFGLLSAQIGVLLSLLVMFFIFSCYWFLYRMAAQGLGLLVYCLLSPGLVLIWTGVLIGDQNIYRIVFMLAIWAFVIDAVSPFGRLSGNNKKNDRTRDKKDVGCIHDHCS